MEEGLLSLKWNNHKSTFFTVLSLLREKHTYTDVTLACEGRLYPAHRFVLSTCSEYFAEIFSSTTGNNIVIVLKDVRRADLEYLLDYMYLGQVDVAQSELASLIKTAECLRIKGLAIPDDEPPKTLVPRRQGDHREREPSPPSKRKRNQVEDDRTESASNGSNSSNNSSRSGASQQVVGSSNSGGSSQSVMRHPPHPPLSASLSQSQSLSSSSAQSSQAPTHSTKTSSSSQSSRLAPPQPSERHTPTSPQPPLTSPTGHSHPSTPAEAAAAVIKQEITEPPDTPEISYLSEGYEESETKPNVGDQDMSMAGPSGLQGGSESWENDPELSGFTGDNYSVDGCEDGADSEVQGGMRRSMGSKANKRNLLPDEDDGEAFLRQLEDKSDHSQRSLNVESKTPNSITAIHTGSRVLRDRSSASPPVDMTAPMQHLQRLQQLRKLTARSHGSVPAMSHPHSHAAFGTVQVSSSSSQSPGGTANHSQVPFGTTSYSNHANPLVCSLCSFVALNVRELIVHRQRLHWKQLTQIQQLQNQQKWHSLGHNPRGEDHSRQHMAASHASGEVEASKDQRKFKCPYCPVEVLGRNNIENHVVTHSVSDEPNRRYWCPFCEQKCRSAPGLSSHIKSHEYQGDC